MCFVFRGTKFKHSLKEVKWITSTPPENKSTNEPENKASLSEPQQQTCLKKTTRVPSNQTSVGFVY